MNATSRASQVAVCAILSRLALLAIVSVSALAISPLPYDTSTTLTLRGLTAGSNATQHGMPIEQAWQPSSIGKVLFRLVSWDALYFTTIAEEGYLWEHYHAFFPGFPAAMKLLSTVLTSLHVPLAPAEVLLASGLILNSVAFVLASVVLYYIAVAALKHEELAFRSALLFCFSPANPFFLALYTESTFALVSFTGIYFAVYSRGSTVGRLASSLLAAMLFAAATSIRSNGVILTGFLLYMSGARSIWYLRRAAYSRAVFEVLSGIGCSILACLPFFMYLRHTYERYCSSDMIRPWCLDRIPNLYSYVQSQYWNVGFLNYFRLHQIPNFFLAAPIIILAVAAIWNFVNSDWYHSTRLGLVATIDRVEPTLIQQPKAALPLGFFNPENFVHIAHLAVLLLTAVPFIHIQVVTRFLLSQCPILYCYIAHVLSTPSTPLIIKRLLLIYIVVFNVLGTILFSNFLPWT